MINYKMRNLQKRKLRSKCLSSHWWLIAKIIISQPFSLRTIHPLSLGLKGFYCNRNKDTNKQVDKRMKKVSKKVRKTNHSDGLRSSRSESINVYLRATRNTHDHACLPSTIYVGLIFPSHCYHLVLLAYSSQVFAFR